MPGTTPIPGLQGIALPHDPEAEGELEEPYVYHFPDGNASVARLLVRALIPEAAPGRTMEDIVSARFDYAKLDVAGSPTRLRLDSSVVRVVNSARGVEIGYISQADGVLHRIRSRHCVLACFNMLVPYMLRRPAGGAGGGAAPERQGAAGLQQRGDPQLGAVGEAGRARDLGVSSRSTAGSSSTMPVSMGSYAFPSDPKQPMVVHMVHVPVVDGLGHDVRAALRAARGTLLDTPFGGYEAAVKTDLSRMLGARRLRSGSRPRGADREPLVARLRLGPQHPGRRRGHLRGHHRAGLPAGRQGGDRQRRRGVVGVCALGDRRGAPRGGGAGTARPAAGRSAAGEAYRAHGVGSCRCRLCRSALCARSASSRRKPPPAGRDGQSGYSRSSMRRGKLSCRSCDMARSASTRPPVWQRAQ